jgi:acetoin utilization deacetylase AcuC-like enzyme
VGRFGNTALRVLRRLRYGLGRRSVHFVYHAAYELPVPGVPLDPLRAQRILAYLQDRGLIGSGEVSEPIPASLANISRVHTAAYLDVIDKPETMNAVLGFTIPGRKWQEFIDLQRLAAGGTIQATRLALRTGRVAVNLGGGFHHATPDRGMGFCIINDIAVAISRLRNRGFDAPILVIDLDIHDGNGTRVVFANDATVYTLSVHNDTWDDRDAVADTHLALGTDVGDDRYLAALEGALPGIVQRFRPGLVLYIAGVDPAGDDELGNWRISRAGMLRRDRFVVEQVRGGGRDIPMAVVLGGGYGASAWRHSARFLVWLLSGKEVDPTEDVDAIARRFRRIESNARSEEARARESGPDWTLEADDLQALGVAAGGDIRILGAYTRLGIELQLERLGILNQIRAKGFPTPTVTVDTSSTLGHTVRVYGDSDESDLLIELRARRDRASIPGMELLYVEWLLLQDPSREFDRGRPRLPGQEHPGLGLLREIVALLLVVCEQLGLDGIMFVPAYYYMAALGRRHLRFVKVDDAAVFQSMREAVAELDLAAATKAIEDGRVVDKTTGQPVAWHTPPMILPVSQRLHRRFDGADFEAALLRYRAALSYELTSI